MATRSVATPFLRRLDTQLRPLPGTSERDWRGGLPVAVRCRAWNWTYHGHGWCKWRRACPTRPRPVVRKFALSERWMASHCLGWLVGRPTRLLSTLWRTYSINKYLCSCFASQSGGRPPTSAPMCDASFALPTATPRLHAAAVTVLSVVFRLPPLPRMLSKYMLADAKSPVRTTTHRITINHHQTATVRHAATQSHEPLTHHGHHRHTIHTHTNHKTRTGTQHRRSAQHKLQPHPHAHRTQISYTPV